MSEQPKLVVLVDGKRVSKEVHTTQEAADAEASKHIKLLTESDAGGAPNRVKVAQLLQG